MANRNQWRFLIRALIRSPHGCVDRALHPRTPFDLLESFHYGWIRLPSLQPDRFDDIRTFIKEMSSPHGQSSRLGRLMPRFWLFWLVESEFNWSEDCPLSVANISFCSPLVSISQYLRYALISSNTFSLLAWAIQINRMRAYSESIFFNAIRNPLVPI